MTVTEKPALRFSIKIFPWLVILASVAVYLATANRWVTLNSLPVVAKVTGWDWWTPGGIPPVLYLLTLPFTWLPPGSAPAMMNALTAILAALTLGTLARSVALLPQDRTREQRQRERTPGGLLSIPTNWIPPLFAVAALGFQMTFWEHATAITGEILNLLLFAHLIRCLLEYRQEQKDSWLYQFVFVYGLATTNNWAMIGFFPVFLIALVWIRGKSFFKLNFLGRMILFGLLGLSLYLLMPAVESARGNGTFGTLLKEQLGNQKLSLRQVPLWIPLILSFVVFLPILSMAVRWPSNMGEANPIASFLTLLMFYLIHAMFLGFSIWVMFDPAYSPRSLGFGTPFLTFYYLIALNIGYYSGYFLLIFRQGEKRGWKRQSGIGAAIGWVITVAIWAGPLVVGGYLIYRNLPGIRGNNTQAIKEFTERLAAQLPGKGAVVLSEEPHLLLLLEAHYAASGQSPHLILDTRSLPIPRYHAILAKRYPDRWTDHIAGKQVPEPMPGMAVAQIIQLNARTNQLYYLHPASGPHIFEFYHQRPRGLVYELAPYQMNQIVAPPSSAEEQKLNNSFWEEQRGYLNRMQPFTRAPFSDAAMVGRYLSRALNKWGVVLYENGRTNEAVKFFADALMVNPRNSMAKLNQEGKVETSEWSGGRTWSSLLRENGPTVIPEIRLVLGQTLAQFGLLRQAAEQFEQAVKADPGKVDLLLSYSEVLLRGQAPLMSLKLLEPARQASEFKNLSPKTQLEFIRHESRAQVALTNFARAEQILLGAKAAYPKDELPLSALAEVYLLQKKFPQALEQLQEQLTLNSNSVPALMNQGAIHLELGDPAKAIQSLDKAAKLSPENAAVLMNLGLAKLRSGNMADAEKHYLKLAQLQTNNPAPHYYLGEIAYQQQKKSEAVRHYETFLTKVPPNSKDAIEVKERLKTLK